MSIDLWVKNFNEASETLKRFLSNPENVKRCQQFSELIIETYQNHKNVFICGNGGSHCDSMHFAEELTGRFRKDRKPLGALALGDPSHTTCVGNDYGFDFIFSRQLDGLGKPGDLFIAVSTSGNSKNVIEAVKVAKTIGIKTIGLLGRDGGTLKNQVDLPIIIDAQSSDRIQEMHIKIIHNSIEIVERALFPENY